MAGVQGVGGWRRFVMVCCGRKNVSRVLPDFGRDWGASRSWTGGSAVLRNGGAQRIKTLFSGSFFLVDFENESYIY